MSQFPKHTVAAAVALAIAVTFGCSSEESGDNGASAGGGGNSSAVSATKHESPQAVFNAAKAAMKANKLDEFVACLTAESQDVMVFGLTMAGQMAKAFGGMGAALGQEFGDEDANAEEAAAEIEKKFAPLDKVFEKYGVTEDALGDEDDEGPMDPHAAVKEIAGMITDKPAYIRELMAALDAISDGEPQGPQAMFNTELSDVKIDGDTAIATATNPDNPNRSGPIHFRKVDGGWLIDLSKEMEQMPAG